MSIRDEVLAAVEAKKTMPSPEERRALRETGGLSVAELARILGVPGPTLSRWELGSMAPRGVNLACYREALDALTEAIR